MLGAALFYGDCLLTPAISVLSAVEGLNVATPAFEQMILPIAIAVLIALFAVQHFGTAGIGHLFGPIMLLWFTILFVLGVQQIVQQPEVLRAFAASRPRLRHAPQDVGTFVALGAVTLALTGAEALYADIGHFGRNPIRAAWLMRGVPGAARQLLRPRRAAAHRSRPPPPIPSSGWRRRGRSILWSRSPLWRR